MTYIGYSQGTEQMIYGLGTNFSFFEEHLKDAIFLAPCLYEENTYNNLVSEFLPLKQAGEYYFGGYDDEEVGPYKSVQYTYQNYVEDKFQEPISIEDYARGQRDSPVIDLGKVKDSIPITFVIGD